MTKNNSRELFFSDYRDYPRGFIPDQFKRHPIYFDELCAYPKANPILIAVDGCSLRYIRRLNGVCLYCDQSPEHYRLTFCYEREVWVLYCYQQYFTTAMHLAQAIQWTGAAKISVIQVRQGKDHG